MFRQPSLILSLGITSWFFSMAFVSLLSLAQDKPWLDDALDNDEPTELRAGEIVGRPDRYIELENQVIIKRGKTEIKAESMKYNLIEDRIEAKNNVRIESKGNIFLGQLLRLKLDTGEGVLESPVYKLMRRNAQGEAKKIIFESQDSVSIIKGEYTTCEGPNPDWYLRMSSLSLDNGREIGVAKNAVLIFKGLPLAGTPFISFPLGDGRVSGFLAPTIATSTSGGLEVTTPFYWNIGTNRDLTIAPHYIAKRGVMLGFTGRYLGENYKGQTRIETLNNDKLTNTSRYAIASKHTQKISPEFTFVSDINATSDDDYATDFPLSRIWRYRPGLTRRLLKRDIKFGYNGNNSSGMLRFSEYQVLQDRNRSATILPPYSRLPQIDYSYFGETNSGFTWNLGTQFTRFLHSMPQMIDLPKNGDRFVFNPRLSYNFQKPGLFFRPSISLHGTVYSLNRTENPQMRTHRFLPTVSVDSGLIFERNSNFFGKPALQTVEPRFFYTYTPYRQQNAVFYPNFDSSEADFNYAQVFRENRFVGNDRIGDANQLTTALMTRYLQSNGFERIRLAVAQRFAFAEQRVKINSNYLPKNTRSDLLFLGSGRVTNQLRLDANFQYSQTRNQLNRMNIGAFWQPAPMKVLNIQYRRDTRNLPNDPNSNFILFDISGQWPIADRWYSVGRLNYLIKEKKLGKSLFGLEYKGDCWIFRFVGQRIPTAVGISNTTFFLQLEFSGLSMLGANPMRALRSNVPGYQPLSPY